MFTGIVQAVATIEDVVSHDGIHTFKIRFPEGFCQDVNIGASISVDGVCLTVTEIIDDNLIKFDVILQSLLITTLSNYNNGQLINVERAAKDGAEIGGHPLSGHIDFSAKINDITEIEGNYRVRFAFDEKWGKYIFPKGYIAINGCSLTIADVDKQKGYFEVWLIPETRRVTTFNQKQVEDFVNIEIERGTQVIVDTIENTLEKKLGSLYPVLKKILDEQKISLSQELTNELVSLNEN